MLNTVVGLDLAATLRAPKVGMAVLRREGGKYELTGSWTVRWTREVLDILHGEGIKPPVLVAIDAPIKLPFGALTGRGSLEAKVRELEELAGTPGGWDMVYTYRPWEYVIFEKLKECGISGRPFSSLAITYRGQVLKELLEDRGWELVWSPGQLKGRGRYFTEVFPNLAIGILDKAGASGAKGSKGERLSRKRAFVWRLFKEGYNGVSLVDRAGLKVEGAGDHLLDAVICAWTGALLAESGCGKPKALCLGNEEYGFVICPHDPDFVARLRSAVRTSPSISAGRVLPTIL